VSWSLESWPPVSWPRLCLSYLRPGPACFTGPAYVLTPPRSGRFYTAHLFPDRLCPGHVCPMAAPMFRLRLCPTVAASVLTVCVLAACVGRRMCPHRLCPGLACVLAVLFLCPPLSWPSLSYGRLFPSLCNPLASWPAACPLRSGRLRAACVLAPPVSLPEMSCTRRNV
jgi:hypothetical protein